MGGLVSCFWAPKHPGILYTLSYTICLIRGLKGFRGPFWRRQLLSTELPSCLANVTFRRRIRERTLGEGDCFVDMVRAGGREVSEFNQVTNMSF